MSLPWESRLLWRETAWVKKGKDISEITVWIERLMQSANRITFLKRKWKMRNTVLYCKMWYRFIDNKISRVKEHLRVGDLAYQR